MHRAPMPAPLPDDEPQQDDVGPLPGSPADDEPVPDHNPTHGVRHDTSVG